MPLRSFLLAAVLLPVTPWAAPCPWLDSKVAAEVILTPPTEVTVVKNPVTGNTAGMTASTTCFFKGASEGVGQLSVNVMEFSSEAAAKGAYEAELKSQGARAKPAKLDGAPAFFTMTPGFSGGSFALKGTRVVFVSHVFSALVKASMEKDPDGEVRSTHDIARRVLTKL